MNYSIRGSRKRVLTYDYHLFGEFIRSYDAYLVDEKRIKCGGVK
jgi:hypothetical protein